MANFEHDEHIRRFMNEVSRHLSFLTKDDKRAVYERLIEAEENFRITLSKHPQSRRIYMKFIAHIVSNNKNILTARPYFRVRSSYFNRFISPAIKKVNIDRLKEFHFNYRFIKFVYDNWNGVFPSTLDRYKKIVEQCREEIVKNDLPLVINRARVFFAKTPQSHLSFHDMIQLSAEGILIGIDKYSGKFSKSFNSVLIGRMSSCMMEEYNSTMIHFYPSDRSIVYSISTIKARMGVEDTAEAVKIYNEQRKADGKPPLDEVYVLDLMNAVSLVSNTLATSDNEDSGEMLLSDLFGASINPEDDMEKADLVRAIISLAKTECSVLEKKYLVLSGLIPYNLLFSTKEG